MNKCKKCNTDFIVSKGLINYCSLKCRNTKVVSEETKLKISNSAKKSEKVLKANRLTNLSNIKQRIKRHCEVCSKEMLLLPSKDKRFCSVDCYLKSDYLKSNGGVRKGSGVGKSGWYKNYWCDSSWELAWVIYHLDNKIDIKRNSEGFEYEYDNKRHLYYPDFIIGEIYYEIKGFVTQKTLEKIKFFKKEIKLIGKNEIKPIIEYVVNKYGKDYLELYEGNPHKKLTKKCPICGGACKSKNIVCSRVCSGKLVQIKS
jgi:predicted nucleic acid-binding Zn ribbon protein